MEKTCQEVYKDISVFNLTSEELKAIDLSDTYGHDPYWITFKDNVGKPYQLIIIPYERSMTLIGRGTKKERGCESNKGKQLKVFLDEFFEQPSLGIGEGENAEDFENVMKLIKRLSKVRLTNASHSSYDTRAYLNPIWWNRDNYTRTKVADLIETYEKHFRDVKLAVTFFHDVPKSTFESSNLSSLDDIFVDSIDMSLCPLEQQFGDINRRSQLWDEIHRPFNKY